MVRTGAAGAGCVALLAALLASGCYKGSARSLTPADLAREQGWERVEGVPEVRQVARRDCGAAALAMVLGYWGLPVTRDQIIVAHPTAPEGGIRAAALRDFARGHGLQAFVLKGELADLEREVQRRRPVLVGTMKVYGRKAYPHYEVVVGFNRPQQRILTLDPDAGLRVNSLQGFAAEWAAAGQLTLIVLPQARDGTGSNANAGRQAAVSPARRTSDL
jgi:ABC-type bacteriocin/lantibiotic exporter with double-glycine peptidase domain